MAARQELHSGLSEMATQTQNYKLHKFELKDAPADITAINASMDIIDTQLKSLADGKFDKTGGTISGNLVVNGSTTLKKLTASELDLNGNADVSGTLKVTGATTLTGALAANGGVTTTTLKATGTSTLAAVNATNISASGTLKVTGATTLTGALAANGGLSTTTIKATGTSTLAAVNATNISASGTLNVTGTTTLTGKLTANGGVTTKSLTATSLDLNGNGDVSGSLTVHGDLNAQGSLNVTDITATGTLKVNGATTLTGLLTANGGVTTKKVTATELDLNGNADISGTLTVHGATTLEAVQAKGNLTVGGLLNVTGSAQLTGGGTVKTPTANVSDTSIINANWAWNLIRTYGLGAGLGTAPAYSGALNDLDTTGFYTLSGTYVDGPAGLQSITGQILHMQRRFEAGTVAFQLLPYSNSIRFRTKNQDTWGGWTTAATQEWTRGQINSLTTLTNNGVKVVGNADYNTLTEPGFYHCNETNNLNGPGGATKLIVLTTTGDAPKHISQVAFPIYNISKDCPAIRYMNQNGNWSDWEKIALVNSRENFVSGQFHAVTSAATRGSIPSGNVWSWFGVQDATGSTGEAARLAMIGHRAGNDGSLILRMHCYPPTAGSEVGSAYIDVGYSPSGEVVTRAPTPVTGSNDNSIATTAFVMAAAGTMTLKATRTSAGSFTVTGLKVNQLVMVQCELKNDTWDGGDYSRIASDNTTSPSSLQTGANTGGYSLFMVALAETVTFTVTNNGISSATWKVYVL